MPCGPKQAACGAVFAGVAGLPGVGVVAGVVLVGGVFGVVVGAVFVEAGVGAGDGGGALGQPNTRAIIIS